MAGLQLQHERAAKLICCQAVAGPETREGKGGNGGVRDLCQLPTL